VLAASIAAALGILATVVVARYVRDPRTDSLTASL
jgi:hypothetical protein